MITQELDHEGVAVDSVASQFKGKANLENYIRAIVGGDQDLETAFFELLTERSIDTGVGEQLNVIGRIVNQARGGLPDVDYRRFLKARVKTNKSNATVDTLIAVAALVTDVVVTDVTATRQIIAAIILEVSSTPIDVATADIVIGFLRAAAAGGVKVHFHHLVGGDADDAFTFADTVTFLDGDHGSTATTLTVIDTSKFALSGSLLLGEATDEEETVAYTGKTPTTFTGVDATANDQDDRGSITQSPDPDIGLGFDDSVSPGAGGELAGVVEAT